MQTTDNRKLTPDAQAAIRLKVVAAIKAGMKKTTAVTVFGVSRSAIYNWLADFDAGGADNLAPKKRGPKDAPRKLLGWQAAQISNLIRDRHPEQMKLPFALWSARAVRDLIRRKHHVVFCIRYVQILLKRWGFTPQKPKRVAYERNPEAVAQWLERDYPCIRNRAKAEKARIYWGDETGVRSDDQLGRTYAPKGQTPVVPATGRRFGCNMISALSNRGDLQFLIFTKCFTGAVFLTFLRRLLKDNRSKVFLIVDGHPAHKGRAVRTWLEEHRERIEVFFLPPYSPDINPDEYVNNDLKTNAVRTRAPRTQRELQRNIRSHMRKRRDDPETVKRFFHAPAVRYAM